MTEPRKRELGFWGRFVRGLGVILLIPWVAVVEALLHTQDDPSLPLRQIAGHGALFPFDLANLTQDTIKANPRLDLFRHGLSEVLVTTKSPGRG